MKILTKLNCSVSEGNIQPAPSLGAVSPIINGSQRGLRLTNNGLFIFKGSTVVCIPTADLISLASANEPGLSPSPTVVKNPASQAIKVGSDVTFTVVAGVSEQPLAYSWTKNGTTIDGSTNASLTLSNVQTGDQAAYACLVISPAGQTISSAAVLTVFP